MEVRVLGPLGRDIALRSDEQIIDDWTKPLYDEFAALIAELNSGIEEFYNHDHAGSGPDGGQFISGVGSLSPAGKATLDEAHGHLQGALNIVGGHTQEGALIKKAQGLLRGLKYGARAVRKNYAEQKQRAKDTAAEEAARVLKLPRWRDTNPSKKLMGRVGEFIKKAANTITQKWKREPEFRHNVYKEAALAISGIGIHLFAGEAALETLGAGHAAVEGVLKSLETAKKLGI